MHDTPRRFPWFKFIFGSISVLVLVGTFGGFMWLLRTYVDPPRIAAAPPAPSAAALLASVSPLASTEPQEPRAMEPRVIMASRDLAAEPAAAASQPEAEPPASALPSSITIDRPSVDRPGTPNAGPAFPSWAGSPLPGAPRVFGVAGGPPPSADAGTVSFDGPVPLPRPKPRVVVRVQLPQAAPLPRPRPPA